MNRFDYEAKYLEAGLEELKNFLLSGDIFWNLSISNQAGLPPYPQLSLGNSLLSAHIVKSGLVSNSQDLLGSLAELQKEWLLAWGKKAEREFNYRIKLWGRALDHIENSQNAAQSSLNSQIRARTVLELLQAHIGEKSLGQLGDLNVFDARFKQLTQEAPFVWASELISAFGPERFWFLYRKLS